LGPMFHGEPGDLKLHVLAPSFRQGDSRIAAVMTARLEFKPGGLARSVCAIGRRRVATCTNHHIVES
jgi:hypothetical protein